MKKQNNVNLIQQKEKSIIKKKIQFLQMQLSQSIKRQTSLKNQNQNLKNSLNQILNDKSKFINIISSNKSSDNTKVQNQLLKQKIKNLEKTYEQKIQQLKYINKQYAEELNRLQLQLKTQINQLNQKHENQIGFMQKKINKYQSTIQKYQKIYNQVQNKSVLKNKIINQNQNLKKQNQIFKKIHRQNSQQSQQNTSNYLIQNSNNNYQSFLNSQNQLNQLKKSFQTDSGTYLNDLQNSSHYANRINQSINYMTRLSNKSKSRISNCSSIRPKSIATMLYCDQCEKDYPPNQFYHHLKTHTKKDKKEYYKLLQQKDEIDKKIKLLNSKQDFEQSREEDFKNIVVVVKNPKKNSPQSINPYKLR